MKPLRILQVSSSPIFDLGGLGKVVQWISEDFFKSGHAISLASPDAESSPRGERGLLNWENRIATPPAKWTRPQAIDFVDKVRAAKFDLVHFHGGTFSFDAHLPWRSPLPLMEETRIPWILTNHCAPSLTEGLFPHNYPLPARWAKSALAWSSKLYWMADCRQEVFASNENRAQIERWYPWDRKKMSTIYNSGLEGEPPAPVFAPEAITISNLGHISWRKGQHDLLAAFVIVKKKFPALHLVLAGPCLENDLADFLRTEISRQNLAGCVELPGGIKEKTAFWRDTDIYVQPSHHEGAPMALMEALWLGKPCIGTRVSGIPEMIDDDSNGLLVAPSDPTGMAVALERMIQEPNLRQRLGARGASALLERGMTRPQMSQCYLDLYYKIINGIRR